MVTNISNVKQLYSRKWQLHKTWENYFSHPMRPPKMNVFKLYLVDILFEMKQNNQKQLN